jgi:hypothetical protein
MRGKRREKYNRALIYNDALCNSLFAKKRREENQRVSFLSVGWLKMGEGKQPHSPSCWNSAEETRSRTKIVNHRQTFVLILTLEGLCHQQYLVVIGSFLCLEPKDRLTPPPLLIHAQCFFQCTIVCPDATWKVENLKEGKQSQQIHIHADTRLHSFFNSLTHLWFVLCCTHFHAFTLQLLSVCSSATPTFSKWNKNQSHHTNGFLYVLVLYPCCLSVPMYTHLRLNSSSIAEETSPCMHGIHKEGGEEKEARVGKK